MSSTVTVVDTSGAGDCFIGALSYFLAELPHLPLREMIARAGRLASMSVQKAGTQSSYPDKAALDPALLL